MSASQSPSKPTLERRAAGILLHPTSLPGPAAGGDIGPAAYAFVDFLAAAGQSWWQMLPIVPIGPGNSPYSSPSAFAGNPLLISLRFLVDCGWLTNADLGGEPSVPSQSVDYRQANRFRMLMLRRAHDALARAAQDDEFAAFCEAQRWWLDDFALFSALRRKLRGRPWFEWPAAVRHRRRAALKAARTALVDEIEFHQFVQFVFDRQWRRLRQHAQLRGIGLIGDLPIFVTHDSADVWAHPELFLLNRTGRPKVVSGCPPDYFSRTGQLWGHPHYDWRAHARDGFAWWIARLRHTLAQFDAVRIDHFLGLHQVWQVPGGARTAQRGKYVRTPGDRLLEAATRALGPMPIIAEDLGNVVPAARELRDRFGYPGMRVLQFGFGDGARYDQPHNYPRNCIAYTGTHDNDTLVGWFKSLSRAGSVRTPDGTTRGAIGQDGLTDRQRLLRYLGRKLSTAAAMEWDVIRMLYGSPANLAIVPLQDVLRLDSAARMNTPGRARGNWEWRATRSQVGQHAARLRELAETYERAPAAR